jgi:hypothetical protein
VILPAEFGNTFNTRLSFYVSMLSITSKPCRVDCIIRYCRLYCGVEDKSLSEVHPSIVVSGPIKAAVIGRTSVGRWSMHDGSVPLSTTRYEMARQTFLMCNENNVLRALDNRKMLWLIAVFRAPHNNILPIERRRDMYTRSAKAGKHKITN